MDEIRVMIADDHTVVRKGIRTLLATEPGIRVVGEARDGEDALHKALALKPDVILMDLVMPKLDGVQATRRIWEKLPDAKILILTNLTEDKRILAAIEAGALGYLLKDSSPEDLIRAIREVARGESSLHPKVAQRLIGRPPGRWSVGKERAEREGARGAPAYRPGAFHQRAHRAAHVSNILRKLGLKSRTQAALYAIKTGLASLNTPDIARSYCI